MADIRHCDQCGTVFTPPREHARFCSGRCRVAWNQQHRLDQVTELSALGWSVAGLADLAPRLAGLAASDRSRAAAVVSEAVWQVTIIDATLVRYHYEVYEAVLAVQPRRERRVTEGTMAGLRFVRNHMTRAADLDALIGPSAGAPAAEAETWTWQRVPEPSADVVRPRGQAWEMSRFQGYQDYLAGYPVADGLGRAAAFVRLAAARMPAVTDVGASAGP